jgi:hypothetical protein
MMPAPQQLLADVEIVRSHGYDVRLVEDGTRSYVVLENCSLPPPYVPQVTNLMLIADYQYPMSALDMFWTEPHVKCPNGDFPQNANQFEPHIGKTWQRWSWHYPGWNPTTHSLVTHLEVCFDRLAQGR